METMKREHPDFSLCGLNCCLCPRFNTEGKSRCPGCGGEGFSAIHPTCAVATCNRKHDNVEYCFLCASYPCPRYREGGSCDSFISYRRVAENMGEARDNLSAYRESLERRQGLLGQLLDGYNDGRSKGLFCLVANDLPLPELEGLLEALDRQGAGKDVKEKARLAKDLISETGKRLGLDLRLRKG